MPEKPLPVAQILALLEAGPPRIFSATADLTESQLQAASTPGEWSANEVLAHLRSCADVWGHAIVRIINEEKPTIRAINPRTWIESTDYLKQDFHPSLQVLIGQRIELLARLKGIPSMAWSRTATITGAGKPLVRSVHAYAQWMATHERPHLKQIERIALALRR